jgi:glycosyltransferase involved in cell wall biosynthesis
VLERRPRLVYVVTLAEVGGAQSYVRDLLPAMREAFDLTVAAHGEGPLRAAAVELGIPFVPLRHVRRPLSLVHDPIGLLELTRLFRRVRPEIVHLNSSKAGVLGRIAAAIARVPVRVFTAHGWAFKATTGPGSLVYLWADRAVRPLTTRIICVSETELRAGLAARVCTIEKAAVIENAVEVGPPRQPRPPDAGRVEIVSVGRLAPPKDFSTLLAAIAHFSPGKIRLTVLGDGPLRGPLEDEVARRGLTREVEFAGEVADVRPYLAASDIFVLSSNSEGMPLSVLEAMAGGLPVVASAVGGLHEVVVEGVTGFLVPPGNSEHLADRLDRLVADARLRERLGREGRRRADERFSLPGWRNAHRALYESLLAAHGGDHPSST